jgi:hypothetical protein
LSIKIYVLYYDYYIKFWINLLRLWPFLLEKIGILFIKMNESIEFLTIFIEKNCNSIGKYAKFYWVFWHFYWEKSEFYWKKWTNLLRLWTFLLKKNYISIERFFTFIVRFFYSIGCQPTSRCKSIIYLCAWE